MSARLPQCECLIGQYRGEPFDVEGPWHSPFCSMHIDWHPPLFDELAGHHPKCKGPADHRPDHFVGTVISSSKPRGPESCTVYLYCQGVASPATLPVSDQPPEAQ